MKRMVIDFACNNPDNGDFRGKCSAVEVNFNRGEFMEIEVVGYPDPPFRYDTDRKVMTFLGKRWPILGAKAWYGNWCWDAVFVEPRIGLGSADADLLGERGDLMARSRDLARNNGIASGAFQTLIDNVVGTGLNPAAMPDYFALGKSKEWARDFRRQVESLWPILGAKAWYGNWCWHAVFVEPRIGLQILRAMRRDKLKRFHCTGGAPQLYKWFNGKEVA